jgi:hypothetical protein
MKFKDTAFRQKYFHILINSIIVILSVNLIIEKVVCALSSMNGNDIMEYCGSLPGFEKTRHHLILCGRHQCGCFNLVHDQHYAIRSAGSVLQLSPPADIPLGLSMNFYNVSKGQHKTSCMRSVGSCCFSLKSKNGYSKITYFRWDFISRFCHIVSLQQSKIHIYERVVIENPLNIFIFTGFIFVIITPSRK